jgi:hypothetical protein
MGGRLDPFGGLVMSSVVGISFCCMIAGGLVGLEWTDISGIGFSLAAFAAIIFFSAIDAWECENSGAESQEAPVAVTVKSAAKIR